MPYFWLKNVFKTNLSISVKGLSVAYHVETKYIANSSTDIAKINKMYLMQIISSQFYLLISIAFKIFLIKNNTMNTDDLDHKYIILVLPGKCLDTQCKRTK